MTRVPVLEQAGTAMRDTCYKAVRTAQSRFPALADRKYELQRWYRQTRRRPFEPDFAALRFLPPSPDNLFLDVGANRGQSIDAVLLTTQQGDLWSFEPNPQLAARLVERYADEPRVTVFSWALGGEPSTGTLFVPAYRGFVYDGLASLDEESAVSWLRGRVYGYRDGDLTVERVRCETHTLDSLACTPTFIKIDVQGFELDVVQGARETIARCEPIVLVEAPDAHVRDALESLGLELYAFDGARFVHGRPGSLNSFFMGPRRRRELTSGGASFT